MQLNSELCKYVVQFYNDIHSSIKHNSLVDKISEGVVNAETKLI